MNFVLLMGCGFLFALAVGQLCVPRRSQANILLSLLILVCLIWLTHGVGFNLGMLDAYPHLNKLHVPFIALTGPLWYVYVRAWQTGKACTAGDKWHLLPALLSCVLLLPFVFQSEIYKREYVEVIITDFASLSAYIATRIAEIALLVYLGLVIIRNVQTGRASEGSLPPTRSNSIALALTTMAFVAAIVRLYGSIIGNHTLSVLVPALACVAVFICMYCLSHRYPWLINFDVQLRKPRRVTNDGRNRLEHYRACLLSNRWHLDPNLKIQQLAHHLGLRSNDLSELINRESGANFNHFINALRIEHAKQQLLTHADKPVLDIALSSGFNSASAFYAQFTRFESMPPTTYRQQAQRQSDKQPEVVS